MKYFRAFLGDIRTYIVDVLVRRKPVSILMYHSVTDNGAQFAVTPKDFENQIEYLVKNKYNVLSMTQLIWHIENKKDLPMHSIVLTFDDGYEDNYTKAFPILKKFNIPATIYVSAGFIGDYYTNKRGAKFKMLSWEQIQEMHNSGLIEIESHTMHHKRLSSLSLIDAEKEIADAKQVIEKKLNKKCMSFAYPYGDTSPAVREIALRYFKIAVTVERGFVDSDTSHFALPRNTVDELVTMKRFPWRL